MGRFPYLVKVTAVYERPELEEVSRGQLPWDQVYAEFREREQGEPASEELLAAFREVSDKVDHATP